MDWRTLSPANFEDVVGDLLEVEHGTTYERFGPGPDGGVDLRASGEDGVVVVQCKHYVGSSWSDLWRTFTGEVDKVNKLQPHRYIIATSRSMTTGQKQKTLQLFAPWIRSSQDVLGLGDLEARLRKHPHVKLAHPAMWMESAEVLQRIVDSKTFTRIRWTLEDARETARVFVRPSIWAEARTMLQKRHVCILSGPPGIGKTTLARMLLLEYVRDGFEPIVAGTNVQELMSFSDPDRHRVFYFDDFLGQNFLGDDRGQQSLNMDQELLQFIAKVESNPKHRLLLTTREYILRDALFQSDRLRRADANGTLDRIVLDASRFARLDKARIFLNHIWHRDLGHTLYPILQKDRSWKLVVDHANFNPRILEVVLDQIRARRLTSGILEEFIASLENPVHVWQTVWRSHLCEADRCVLRAAGTLPSPLSLEQLRGAWERVSEHYASPTGTIRFEESLEKLEGTFLTLQRNPASGKQLVQLANPSVNDFLTMPLIEQRSDRLAAIEAVAFVEQACYLAQNILRFEISWAAIPRDAESLEELSKLLRAYESTEFRSASWIRQGYGTRGYVPCVRAAAEHLSAFIRRLGDSVSRIDLVRNWTLKLAETVLAGRPSADLARLAGIDFLPDELRERLVSCAIEHLDTLREIELFIPMLNDKARPLDQKHIDGLRESFNDLVEYDVDSALGDEETFENATNALGDIDRIAEALDLPAGYGETYREQLEERFGGRQQDDNVRFRQEERTREHRGGTDAEIDRLVAAFAVDEPRRPE